MPQTILKPKALKRGDTIAIISPAAPTPDKTAFKKGKQLLEEAGFNVRLMPNCQNQNSYLAGSDQQRLSDLHQAFEDPEIDGILCARGGYGCMRLLPKLDFALIKNNPKVFIGFSDVTVLHTAFYQQAGLLGFYGPMLTSNLVQEIEAEAHFSLDQLLTLVTTEACSGNLPLTIPNRDAYHCFTAGVAKGALIGGNLSLLAGLCGTPWQPQTDGHILFIEDWRESYYTLDRQFQQLKLAGLFNNIAGLLLCDFSEIPDEFDYPLAEQLRLLTAHLDVPVGYGFSVGHGSITGTLPIGCRAEFNSETGTLKLLESAVEA